MPRSYKIIILFLLTCYFSIALPELYADAKEGSRAGADIDAYKQFLEKLDKDKKDSILSAKDELSKKISQPNRNSDEAFRLFWRFYREVIVNVDKRFRWLRDYQDLLSEISEIVKIGFKNPLPAFEKLNNKSSREIREKYANILNGLYAYRDCGISFVMSEGDWYLEEDIDFLVKISSFLKGALREYIIFYAEENREIIAEDAGLLITWDELRKAIIRYEKYSKNHPNLIETEEQVKPELEKMFHWYLFGLSNTRAYNTWETGQLELELKKSYEHFLKENKSSVYYRIIEGIYKILRKHNFKINKELISFLDTQGYKDFQLEYFLKRNQ